jgi:hypothetical protein
MAEMLRDSLLSHIGIIGGSLLWLAFAANIDLAESVRGKFNRVSERMGFPERL